MNVPLKICYRRDYKWLVVENYLIFRLVSIRVESVGSDFTTTSPGHREAEEKEETKKFFAVTRWC